MGSIKFEIVSCCSDNVRPLGQSKDETHVTAHSEIEDCTREWTFRESDFDFVHIRYLLGCIPDWEVFFKEAFKVLKPGGYLESYEASPRVYSDDGTLSDKDAIAQWGPLFIEGGKAIGRSFTIVDDGTQKEAMEKAGFVDIQEKLIKVSPSTSVICKYLTEVQRFLAGHGRRTQS